MNETLVTVVGNVATTPVFRELPSGSVARFRLAATARRRDPATGLWSDGHTNFFTVWAWRALGSNVAASLSVGEPVIVQGKLRVRNEERSGGQQWTSADIDALAVGHDLSRGTSAFRRALRTDNSSGEQQPGARNGTSPPESRSEPAAGAGAVETSPASSSEEPAWERDPVREADRTAEAGRAPGANP